MPEVETSKAVAPALKTLLSGFIDYAGLFPPAKVELTKALANYQEYRQGEYSWMLRWFVIGSNEIDNVPEPFNGCLAVLAEADSCRAATVESTAVIKANHPVYCEVPLNNLPMLDAVKGSGNFAKIRTGGLKPEAIPAPADVAAFILACADRKLPFKATAGLHHPIRSEQPLTYEANAPRAVMHGFINVLMAAAFAWHGERYIEPIIAEEDAKAFSFGEGANWRNRSLTNSQIKDARDHFVHSVGSCSFEEPVQDLKAMGLL